MSGQAESDTAYIIAEYSNVMTGGYCNVAASTLIFYEYIITFRQEVELFWKGKLTGSTVLFLLNRYFVLLFNCYSVGGSAPISAQSCPPFQQAELALLVSQYFPWAVFSTLRVYALGRSWLLAASVLALSSAPIGINLSPYGFGVTGEVLPLFGCGGIINMDPALATKLVVVSRSCLMGADIIVILVTWHAIAGTRSLMSLTRLNGFSFTEVFLRDGTIYFIVLLLLNSLHLALTVISFNDVLQTSSWVTVFTEPITAIMVSRFLLHIQETNRKAIGLDASGGIGPNTSSHIGTLIFDRVIGSLGSSIVVGEDAEHDAAEELRELNQDGSIKIYVQETLLEGMVGR